LIGFIREIVGDTSKAFMEAGSGICRRSDKAGGDGEVIGFHYFNIENKRPYFKLMHNRSNTCQ